MERKKKRKRKEGPPATLGRGGKPAAQGPKPGQRPPQPKVGRPPRHAAITLTLVPGSGADDGGMLAKTRKGITLEDYGIPNVVVKRAITEALILEIPEENSDKKADKLWSGMVAALGESEVRIAKPVKTCDFRIKGLDESVTLDKIKTAVATVGGCRLADIKVSRARASSNGLFTAWIQCPVVAARKVVGAESLLMGWVKAPVKPLERRPLQCFRCLRHGYVTATCCSTAPEKNRRGRCYRCGDSVMVCNAAMPRTRGPPNWSVYWSTGEIAGLRAACARSRNQYTHALRHKDVAGVTRATAAYKKYRQARKALRTAISQAKSRA
ncbi:uncharacterized protein LOC109862063 [Pseudomyrmex gracilis]|uniref:uncharacterized protein LOC109862063 n=1 Tax=Pseudomyrmex gracilis TaxID=219809 RepID=UPI00099538AD|nr:uncharacterized protein LOC109862063 [Pseudomyrmex gracilis]